MSRFRIVQHEDRTVSLYALNLKRYLSVDPGHWSLKASTFTPDEWCRLRVEYKPAAP